MIFTNYSPAPAWSETPCSFRMCLWTSAKPNCKTPYALVAEMDGRVVGSIDISRKRNRLAHVASIGMAVHDDYQNIGIGTALMKAALDMTDNWLNIRRVELDVYTDNLPAVHLYEKFGFVREGVRKRLAFREGEYVDAYHMARLRE